MACSKKQADGSRPGSRQEADGRRQHTAHCRWRTEGTGKQQAAGRRQQAAASRQQAAGSRQQQAGSRQQAACGRRQTTGSRKQAAGSRQKAAGGYSWASAAPLPRYRTSSLYPRCLYPGAALAVAAAAAAAANSPSAGFGGVERTAALPCWLYRVAPPPSAYTAPPPPLLLRWHIRWRHSGSRRRSR